MAETKRIDCPCCGKTKVGEYEFCEACGWQNDPVQLFNPKIRGANQMTIEEARQAYAEGGPVK